MLSKFKNIFQAISKHKALTALGLTASLALLNHASTRLFGENKLSSAFEATGALVTELPGLFWVGVGLVGAAIAVRAAVAGYERIRKNQLHRNKVLSHEHTLTHILTRTKSKEMAQKRNHPQKALAPTFQQSEKPTQSKNKPNKINPAFKKKEIQYE